MSRTRVLLLAAGLLILGCGGDGNRATARTPAAEAATATPASTATPPTAQAARPGLRLKRIGKFSSPVFLTAAACSWSSSTAAS